MKNRKLHFELLTRSLNFYFFRFRVTNSSLKNKKFHFELIIRRVQFYFLTFNNSKGTILFSHFRVTNAKLINEKISLIIAVSKWHGLPHSITFFVFGSLCCKYICDNYLSMLDFNGLPSSNGLIVDRLIGPGLMFWWNEVAASVQTFL